MVDSSRLITYKFYVSAFYMTKFCEFYVSEFYMTKFCEFYVSGFLLTLTKIIHATTTIRYAFGVRVANVARSVHISVSNQLASTLRPCITSVSSS